MVSKKLKMVEEKARVIIKSETHVWAEAEHRTGCNICTVSKGCGTGAIAKHMIKKPILIKAFNPIGAEVGDMVIMGIPEGTLLLGSFVLYIIPLLVMFLGAGLGEILAQYLLGNGESLVISLGLGGLSVGILGTQYIQTGSGFEPRIMRTIAKATVENKAYSPRILS